MHWVIFCMTAISVFGELHSYDGTEVDTTDYEYTAYDAELKRPAIASHRVVRKTNEKHETHVTHRQVELILTEPTIATTTNEERKLRYNEKVYLPEVRGVENTTSEPHQVFKNNISIALMAAAKSYQKDAWDRICQPLTGTAHPDGPLDYFDAIQAMRPPNLFPADDEGPASIKFFDEKRYPVKERKMLSTMKNFLKCLLSVISHVAEDSKRRKMTRMFYTSMIGWLKDSLLIDMYALPERPDDSIIGIEDTVEALVYMRNKHFVPAVAKEALKTYEFVSVGSDDDRGEQERERGFQVTTAIMITVGVALVFVLVLLAACVAAALSSPALQEIGELPEDFLPLDYRPSQLMDRTGRRESLTRSSGPRVAVPAGYDQQVRKLSELPDSDIGDKVRRTSMEATQEQMTPLLGSESGYSNGLGGSTSLSRYSIGDSTR
ncbi:uncharacterized protein LOC122386685 isoform X2 [Amphibalanus amphitrite]|uniref:uncharacterized protein LOC122384353 isoform X1 n=2 Tax=Amphibalanus amphitrite TaxID=1232801 RepID=UPI001C90AA4A|nr:uncharacterized protein LOC122384353 isoform X1 [Amphibalanus amphitrite]XP_043232054.1 uncharacterized protein LOC122386685 isoform X2 [Amphibalanus amphitrite]